MAGFDGDEAHQRFKQGGFADAVAWVGLQADVAQDVRAAIVLVDFFDV